MLGWVAVPFSQGIFPTQESNPRLLCLLYWLVGPLPDYCHLGSPLLSACCLCWSPGEDLRVPWTARRSNQSVLKEINSLEGQTLKLKCQNLGLLMRRVDSLERTLMLGKIEGKSRMR